MDDDLSYDLMPAYFPVRAVRRWILIMSTQIILDPPTNREREVQPLRRGQWVGFAKGVKWFPISRVGEREVWVDDVDMAKAIDHPDKAEWAILQRCRQPYPEEAEAWLKRHNLQLD